MAEPLVPDVVVNVCHRCIPQAGQLPRQWKQGNSLVSIRQIPCSGKVDLQYLLHMIEDVRGGVCVVACPTGTCRLGQGNQRAEVRMQTLRRLLGEVGLEPERAELLHFSSQEPVVRLEAMIKGVVQRINALGPNPVAAAGNSNPPPASDRVVRCSPEERANAAASPA